MLTKDQTNYSSTKRTQGLKQVNLIMEANLVHPFYCTVQVSGEGLMNKLKQLDGLNLSGQVASVLGGCIQGGF